MADMTNGIDFSQMASYSNVDRFYLSGLPKQDENYTYYNEQEYKDEYDYGDEDTPSIEVEGAASILTHRPVIISEPINTDVDKGMTIRLP